MPRSVAALVGASMLVSGLVTAGVAYGLSGPVSEPTPVTWSPGDGAPAVAVFADRSARTADCGGGIAGLPAGAR